MQEDASPISSREARALFAGLKAAPAVVLAVSGGPDSVALLWLAARWRRALARGPRLHAVTIDHGLRPEAAREARDVKCLARSLDVGHRTMRWRGDKPKTGLPAAARAARYGLLAQAARRHGATHIVTAHTRDDQAETVLMRMSRGSGLAGLAAMAPISLREGLVLARPFLDVPKARLIATIKKVGIDFARDPTNHDPAFTRPRLRALMPMLASEGCDARNLARLAARLARANASLEMMADGAERFLARIDPAGNGVDPDSPVSSFDAAAFSALSDEMRLRLLLRAIARAGHEGPAELGKVENLLAALDGAMAGKVRRGARPVAKQTLAGALITVARGRLLVEPAPPRRGRRHGSGVSR
jgi:tRNA(Ile)-lysidine synthase